MSSADDTANAARPLVEPAHLHDLLRRRAPDAERVALFAGLITKVQHNFLWEEFPGTVTMLRRAGVELELFRDYFLSGKAPRTTKITGQDDKVNHAVSFADEFLRAHRTNPRLLGVRDVLLHERRMWEVRRALASWSRRIAIAGAPLLHGPMRVAYLRFPPEHVLSNAELVRAPRYRMYFGSPRTRSVRAFDIDRVAAAVVAGIASCVRLETVIRRAAARGVDRAVLVAVLVRLEREGCLTLPAMETKHANRPRR